MELQDRVVVVTGAGSGIGEAVARAAHAAGARHVVVADLHGAEAERVAREQAEPDRLARQAAARDRVLLDTFTTEEDLLLARDGKVQAIDARIQHTRNVVAKLDENLHGLEEQAAKAELSGQPVPAKLTEEIHRVKRQIEENRGFISVREHEKTALMAQFEQDLNRYRELKGK